MPRVTLTFDLPDERQDMFDALRGSQWKDAWTELGRAVRLMKKHGSIAHTQQWAEELWALMWELAPGGWEEEE